MTYLGIPVEMLGYITLCAAALLGVYIIIDLTISLIAIQKHQSKKGRENE